MKLFLKTLFTWLIVCIAGSAILSLGFGENTLKDSFGIFFSMSLGLSAPGMFLYHFIACHIYNNFQDRITRKTITALAALFITAISAYVFMMALGGRGADGDYKLFGLIVILPYGLPFMFTSLFFDYATRTYNTTEEIPLNQESNIVRNRLMIITFSYVVMELKNIVSIFSILRFYSPTLIISNVVNIIIVITGLILLWKNIKAGWYIQVFMSVLGVTGNTIFIIKNVFRLGNTPILTFPAYTELLLPLPLVAVTVWMLLSKEMRVHYKISNKNKAITIIAAILVSLGIAIVFR